MSTSFSVPGGGAFIAYLGLALTGGPEHMPRFRLGGECRAGDKVVVWGGNH
jgi:hypothetical protein